MNKTWIIIQREFAVRIKKKSFIILTILMPFLIAALVFVPALLSTMSSDKESKIAVVDLTEKYAPLLKNTDKIQFHTFTPSGNAKQMCQRYLKEDSGYDIFIYIQKDLTRSKDGVTVYSTSEVPHNVENYVNDKLNEQIRNARLSQYKIENIDKVLADAKVDFSVKTVRWDENGNTKVSSSEIAGIVGLVLSLFIYMFILSYGSMVMQGVMEEKTNRIVEIMVSSVKPQQLMFGKITGIAFVGLFQFLIWILMLLFLLTAAGAIFGISTMSPDVSTMALGIQIPQGDGIEFLQVLGGMNFAEIIVLFILYFIGGYLLFAAIFAAIGASVNEQQDSQQFMMPIIMIFVFALYAGMFSIENPDGPLALWCSFIPFTSPIVMMVRLPFDLPVWQIILSLGLLYGTAWFIVWFAAKIYRVGILMYGRKPTFKDMLKWLSYK